MNNITITGDLGSGKSTVSKKLIEQEGFDYITVGTLFREEAKRRGVTVEELNKLAETNPIIDKTVDDMQIEMGRIKNKTIFDSRLAFHFVPDSFKIYLMVNLKESAKRIYADNTRVSEEHISLVDTQADILRRRGLELARYKDKYGVDYSDYSNYDLVLDTTCITSDEAVSTIMHVLNNTNSLQNKTTYYLCVKNIHPTRDIKHIDLNVVDRYRRLLNKSNQISPIEVVQLSDTSLHVVDGHHRLFMALSDNIPLIQANITRIDGVLYNTVASKEFEEAFGFTYK